MRVVLGLAAAAVLSLAACRGEDRSSSVYSKDLGTGLNTVERQYGKEPQEVWDAAVAAVKSYDLKIESDPHDSLGGNIQARRGDGQKVGVIVRGTDKKQTQVSVRVEPGDRNMADLIHERIAEKLGMGEAKGALFGGNTADGTYESDLAASVKAAEKACSRLDLTVTNKETHDTWAQVDARQKDSTPVRIKMSKSEGKSMKVTFIAGRGQTDTSRSMVERMKAEFERQLAPQAQ